MLFDYVKIRFPTLDIQHIIKDILKLNINYMLHEDYGHYSYVVPDLSARLSCGRATARKIGEQAGAKIVIGRRVLYSIEKVKKYLLYLEE